MTDDAAQHHDSHDPPHRKKYTFKKRDPVAAAKLEQERVASIKHNPFGDAKPRESVIAQRTGKDEAKVLEEEALSYEVHLKLTSEQFAEKKARQEEIENLKASLEEGEVDDADAVKAEISQKEADLEQLVKGFEELLVEKAKAGDLPRVERKPFMRGEEGGYGEDGGHSRPHRGGGYRDQYDASGSGYGGGGGFGGGGGYGGAFGGGGGGGGGGGYQGDHDSHRGGDNFGAGYGSAGGGGGYQRRRGGGRGGGARDYQEAGGGGYGGRNDGGGGGYGGRNEGGGGGYNRNYPMNADSDDYRPFSER